MVWIKETMKARKPKSAEPSLRDKLSANFMRAFESDFETHGAEVIEQLRQKHPDRYAQIATQLIAAVETKIGRLRELSRQGSYRQEVIAIAASKTKRRQRRLWSRPHSMRRIG
jgi:hypothetical protein